MKSLLQRVGWVADKALSVVIWLHDSVMLFMCLFWLLPLIVLVVVSAFIYDLRPVLRERIQEVFLYTLLGLPLWIGVCLYAQFGATSTARRISHWMGRMPAYVGCVLLGVGGLLWLLDIILRRLPFGSLRGHSALQETSMNLTVGLKQKGKVNHVVVDAEDALIAALKAKTAQPEALIMYVRPQNRRGDARHPPLARAKDAR